LQQNAKTTGTNPRITATFVDPSRLVRQLKYALVWTIKDTLIALSGSTYKHKDKHTKQKHINTISFYSAAWNADAV